MKERFYKWITPVRTLMKKMRGAPDETNLKVDM